jgi:periplasmic divalent cation tolerance protein
MTGAEQTPPMPYIQVLTSVDRKETAERIASLLLEERLAACVQIVGPITSHYHWRGRIESSEEWLCLAKSREGLYPAIEKAIRSAHPYEEPEILALPIVAGSHGYLAWLDGEVRPEIADL